MGLVSAEIFYYIKTRTNVTWTNVDAMASYLLRNSIIFKLGQMLYRQMLTVQMSPGQLTTHTDGLTI